MPAGICYPWCTILWAAVSPPGMSRRRRQHFCPPRLIFSLRQPAIHSDVIYHRYTFIKFMPGKWKFSILALVNTDISSQRPVSDSYKQKNEFCSIKNFFSWVRKAWFPLQLDKTNPPNTLHRHLNFNIWKVVSMTNNLLLNFYWILFHS